MIPFNHDHRLIHCLLDWWKRLTKSGVTHAVEARKEYVIKVIMLVMTIALYIFTVIVLILCLLNPDRFNTILIMFALDLGATISVWFTHRGGWRYTKYMPVLVFVLLGMVGAYLYGLVSNLVIFYAIAVVVAALVLDKKEQWGCIFFSVTAHSVLGQIFHPEPLFDFFMVSITLLASLIGLSFIIAFAMRQTGIELSATNSTTQNSLGEIEENRSVKKENFNSIKNLSIDLQNTQKFFFQLKKRNDGEIYAMINEKTIPKQFNFNFEKINSKNIKEIWNKEVLNIVLPEIHRAFNGEVAYFDIEINHVQCHFILTPVFIQGIIKEISVVCTDITEQKRAQIALKESEERLRRITDNMLDMVIQTDSFLNYLYISPSIDSILGYKPDDLLGKSIYYLVHTDDRLREMSTRQLLADFKTPTKSIARYKHAQGHYIWLEMISKPLFSSDGEFNGIIQGARDISENRRTEEALLASEKRFRSVFDNASVGISLIDRQGYIQTVNETQCKFLGYSQEELTSMHVSDFLYPEDLLKGKLFFDELEAGKRDSYTVDKRHLRKDGKIVWGRLSISGLHEANNRLAFTVVICENITETKRAETLQNSLYRISEAAGSCQDLPQLYKAVHQIIGELIPATNFYIALHEIGTDVITFPYHVDEFDENPITRKLGRGLTEYVLRSGKPVLASPEKFDELVKAGEVESIGTPSIDWMGVPLKTSQNITIGAMVVQTYTKGIRYTDEDKEMLTFVSMQVGMAIERKRSEAALKESEHRWLFALEGSGDGVWDWDLTENSVQYSHRWKEMLGYKDDEISNQLGEWNSRVHPEDFPRLKIELQRHFNHEIPVYASEYRMLCKDGKYKWMLDRGKVLSWGDDGAPLRMIGTHSDISERKKTEARLEYMSTHDILTGLFNRNFFETELQRLQSSRYYPITILIADVDGLKKVNDNMGHTAGDNLLKASAQIFSASFRPDDIIARIGGDEFCVLLPNTDAATGQSIQQRVMKNINQYNKNHEDLPINFSMGLATGYQEHRLNQVFMLADSAMYQVKEEKKKSLSLSQ